MTGTVERLLTEHLDTWTAAVETKSAAGRGSSKKLKLVGIAKLRELILELAVRGQLVPQDESDEPASVLLERIVAEKEQLLKDKKISKQSRFDEIDEAIVPFDSPNGWCFVRLGEITNRIGSGSTPRGGKNAYLDNGIAFLRSQNVLNDGLKLNDVAFISDETHEKMKNTKVFPKDILLNITGGSLGRCALIPDDFSEANVSQHVSIIRPTNSETRSYLHLCILSPYTQRMIWGRQVGMAREGLSKKVLEQFEIPLPPLAEQNRIVAKVDELMALCDALEQEQESSIAAHGLLVENLLDALTNAAGQGEFKQAWARVAAHFDTLFTTEQSVEQLKQTILQLAVMGKLVEQDPEDEPAAVLLERIAAEKARLVEEKVIKKQKALPELSEEEKVFELPEGWVWCRFGDISFLITDGAHHTPTYISQGVPFLSVKDMSSGVLSFADTRFISNQQHQDLCKRCKPEKGDLLLTKVGTTGIPILIDTDKEFSIFVSVALIKFPVDEIYGEYLSLLVKSPLVKAQSDSGTEGVGNKNLVLRKISAFSLPIPPLKEQLRIAKKVADLMRFCDQLKFNILESNISQLLLANALTEKTVL